MTQDADQDATDFEQEKWRTEVDFRRRELELKERGQTNQDADIELKRKDQASSAWRNPLIVAIFAAAVAAAGNSIVTGINGNLQRDLETKKYDSELQLERSKSESNRILEMIKTGNTEIAAANLEFLLKSGLVTDSTLISKLSEYLQQRVPGSGPSLPSPTSRIGFEQSGSLSQPIQQTLQKLFDSYFNYLDKIGFPPSKKKVTIKIETRGIPNAYYIANGKIVIDSSITNDPSIALREYNHHVLMATVKEKNWQNQLLAIESGLADYFSCSFLNNPKFGEKSARVLGNPNSLYIRMLSNNRRFSEFAKLKDNEMNYAGAEIWGGAFWGIRNKFGRDVADSIIASAWLKWEIPKKTSLQASEFVAALLAEARTKGQAEFAATNTVLQIRGFPVQPQR
jgi:hypothetical protein